MATVTDALGRVLDLSPCIVPVDTQTGAMTGKRISMSNCASILVVGFKAAGVGTDYWVLTLNEHTAYTGGTSQVLATITKWWYKAETTLDGDEAWVATTQVAGSTLSPGVACTGQAIIVFEVRADSLSDGFTHISVDLADTGSAGTQPGCILYIPTSLKVQRIPSNMPNWLNPGAANV